MDSILFIEINFWKYVKKIQKFISTYRIESIMNKNKNKSESKLEIQKVQIKQVIHHVFINSSKISIFLNQYFDSFKS